MNFCRLCKKEFEVTEETKNSQFCIGCDLGLWGDHSVAGDYENIPPKDCESCE